MQLYYSRSHSSDQLRPIHLISDQVWGELRANGTIDPFKNSETSHNKITHRVLRYEIGRQVRKYAENSQMTNGEISQAIVKGMSFSYRLEPAPFRKAGEMLHTTAGRTPTVVRKEIGSFR
jgi:hypothetical protein